MCVCICPSVNILTDKLLNWHHHVFHYGFHMSIVGSSFNTLGQRSRSQCHFHFFLYISLFTILPMDLSSLNPGQCECLLVDCDCCFTTLVFHNQQIRDGCHYDLIYVFSKQLLISQMLFNTQVSYWVQKV